MSVSTIGHAAYEKVYDFQNLYKAHLRSRRGKRGKTEVIRFELKLAENLARMSEELKNHSYQMSGYYHFTIYEPKQREIFAAYYRDRVLLHCICDEILAPAIGPRLIYDNAACQIGKGTHFALNRFSKFLREHYKMYGREGYVLKCDICKYFANIDHEVLKTKLKKVISDQDILNLLFLYIDSYETEEKPGKGLPLGNQSSQWFGIYYLDSLDRMIKEKLRIKHYVRYMDDCLLLHPDKEFLLACAAKISDMLKNDLHLELNRKTQIYSLHRGVEFLGWRFFLTDTGKVVRKLKKQSKTRMRRRLCRLQKDYAQGIIGLEDAHASFASYMGHLRHGNTYHLQTKICRDFVLRRGADILKSEGDEIGEFSEKEKFR